jgi:hypothetical protein
MTTRHQSAQIRGRFSPRTQSDPRSYNSIVDRLLSEMASMVRTTETRAFDPPFKLLILSNQGVVVFSGEIGRNGRLRCSSPAFKIRRSHFPANVVITDASNAVRTFRIDRPTPRSVFA